MRATIKDIALETGFSVTTISLVLNGKAHKISEGTKKRILETAEKLHYRPNQLAVSLVKKRSRTIGLIVPDIGNVYFADMARGVEDACREHGMTLILCNSNERHERDIEYINMLADKGADGVLYIMAKDSTEKTGWESFDLLEEMRLPFVLLDRMVSIGDYCGVSTDHMAGGYMAARHLIEMGHQRIACVTGPDGILSGSRMRYEGFVKALDEAGIMVDPKLVFEGSYTVEGGEAAIDHLIGSDFTAVFACNDASAYGVCKRLKSYGKRVPEDVSVVGYDDVAYADMLGVPLTTVRQEVRALGREAVSQLTAVIKEKKQMKQSIVFKPALVVRESTSERT